MGENTSKIILPESVLGKNARYYKNIESRKETGLMFPSWNWPAFFFGHVWLIYRRCYLGAFCGYLIHVAILFFLSFAIYEIDNSFIEFLVGCAPGVFFGIYGNALYYIFMNKKLQKLNMLYPDKEQYVTQKCLPSSVPVWVYFGVLFVILLVVSIIFGLMIALGAAMSGGI